MRLPALSVLSAIRQTLLQTQKAASKTTLSPLLQRYRHCSANQIKMLAPVKYSSDFFIRQLFDETSWTYSYLLADLESGEAVIIDPVLEQAKRDAQLVQELGFTLKYALNTHMHADHITGSGWLKQLLPGCQSVIARASGAKADKHLDEGDSVTFGRHCIDALATPGHTNGCMTYVIHEQGCVFTGDTLLIRGCGRTDFQEGNSQHMYENIHNKIFTLPDNFRIFPAHDYKGKMESSVWEEKKYNPRLTKTMEDFIELMDNLNLPYPKKIANKYSVHNEHSDTKSHDADSNVIGNGSGSQCATTGRRRKGASLGGTLSARSCRSEAKELRSALQDREAVIQNLRIQLCLGKLPRPTGPPLDETEKPAAEQKLQRLKTEAENKKIKIRNLKCALEKLDITDNIDIRIRQAELEYALGREELQMLSVVEEARALQARLEKSKPELQTIYNLLNSGVSLSLHAVHATTGRWAAHTKSEQPGFYVEWALEGDGLYKGDRILEVNGKIIACKTKEELQKVVGNSGKSQMVVLRKKTAPIPQKQLDQEKENNLRLQHRISYLEEQVRELQTTKEQQHHQQPAPHQASNSSAAHINGNNSHVTSINISSPPSTPPEKPLIFQRGNYITTLVGGKPIELLGDGSVSAGNTLAKSHSAAHITKTLIKENTQIDIGERTPVAGMPPKSLSASKISINSDSAYMQHYKRDKERHRERERDRYDRSTSKMNALQQRANLHARSVEHLNHYNGLERRRDGAHTCEGRVRLHADMRSVKSLDFDSENESTKPISDSVSEVRAVRPTPPKKPLRLSLQRAQSLQTVELNPNCDLERKRPLKRAHINGKLPGGATEGAVLIENCSPLQTSSLGRSKHNI